MAFRYYLCQRRWSSSSKRVRSYSSTVSGLIATFCFITGFACLVDDRNAHRDPSPALLSKWDSARLKAIKHQLALAEEEQDAREQHTNPAMSEEAIRKRRERERKKSGAPSTADGLLSEQPDHDIPSSSQGDQERAPGRSGLSGATYTIHVSASSSTLEWYNQPAHSYTTLTSAREAGIWDYPATADERARCSVFRDLWEKGYSMGGGIKFGGDYLVYPGTRSCFCFYQLSLSWSIH